MVYDSSLHHAAILGQDSIYWEREKWQYDRHVGEKEYEIKDHLGNVRMTFSDLKQPIDETDFTLGFELDFNSISNYYPFGMQMPGMSWTRGGGYRYGFGSHEEVDEVYGNGNKLSFGDYGYDPRLGRRWNIDPMSKKYPNISGYSTFNNSPILYKDPTGNEFAVYIDHSANNRIIVIKQTHYVLKGDTDSKTSAELGVDFWNQQSDKYSYKVNSNMIYNIRFDLSVKEVDNPNAQRQIDNLAPQYMPEGSEKIIKDGSSNDYKVLPDNDLFFELSDKHDDIGGLAFMDRTVGVKESYKTDQIVSAHEIGHTLGLGHSRKIMASSLTFTRLEITRTIIKEILKEAMIIDGFRDMINAPDVIHEGLVPKNFDEGKVITNDIQEESK
ncbi:MAG: hypothetical protein Kapaf2KO_00960 [Candidatus Kapaibacteriales bacterium]